MRPDFRVGQVESAVKTLTEQDFDLVVCLLQIENPDDLHPWNSQDGRQAASDVLLSNLVTALLNARLPGVGSKLLSQQLEYLAPVQSGDTLISRVEVTAWQPEKRLITLKTDCFNQSGRQMLTGQAVLAILA